jgi:hypothetical protein
MRFIIFLPMLGKNLYVYLSIIFSSIVVSVFASNLGLIVNVSAQDTPDYLLGNLTLERNLTKEQRQEIIEKVTNYTSTMKKEANGNITKLNILLTEDLAKRNIIDAEAKEGLLSFISSLPKAPIETLPGTIPGNLTIPGNTTELLKELDATSALLDEIAINNTDSQPVSLMTDILKKRVTDIGTFVSGNGTDNPLGPVTIGIGSEQFWANIGKTATCTLVAMAYPGAGAAMATSIQCVELIQ